MKILATVILSFLIFPTFAAPQQDTKPASTPAGVWTDAKSGITLNIPAGFEVFESEESVQLRGEPRADGGFNCVFVINTVADDDGLNAATQLSIHIKTLKKDGVPYDQAELRVMDGRDVARSRTVEKAPDGRKLRGITIIAPVPGQMIVISAVVAEERFAAIEKTVESFFSSIKFGKHEVRTEFAGTRVEGSNWILPKMKLSIPIPRGWNVLEIGGKALLIGNRDDAFGDNINVLSLSRAKGEDAAALLKINETAIGKDNISKSEVRTVAGEKCAYLRWSGKDGNRIVSVLIPKDSQQIVVTATILASRWKENEATVESIIKGIEFIKK